MRAMWKHCGCIYWVLCHIPSASCELTVDMTSPIEPDDVVRVLLSRDDTFRCTQQQCVREHAEHASSWMQARRAPGCQRLFLYR